MSPGARRIFEDRIEEPSTSQIRGSPRLVEVELPDSGILHPSS